MNKAESALIERLPSQSSILELGCGSGILAQRLLQRFRTYCGVDIAENAIQEAENRCAFAGARAVFVTADVTDTELPRADVTVFLGLTDWLTEAQLAKLFLALSSPVLLFSYSEAVPWYTAYRRFKDRDGHYGARTFTFERMQDLARPAGYQLELFSKAQLLNPGALVWASKRFTNT
jgi:SAM-dependent methyltransferase